MCASANDVLNILDFPPDMLFEILSYLHQSGNLVSLALTCKHFSTLVRDSVVWEEMFRHYMPDDNDIAFLISHTKPPGNYRMLVLKHEALYSCEGGRFKCIPYSSYGGHNGVCEKHVIQTKKEVVSWSVYGATTRLEQTRVLDIVSEQYSEWVWSHQTAKWLHYPEECKIWLHYPRECTRRYHNSWKLCTACSKYFSPDVDGGTWCIQCCRPYCGCCRKQHMQTMYCPSLQSIEPYCFKCF